MSNLICLFIVRLCLILCNPMDCSLPGSSVHGIFQARILEWVAISYSRGSSRPGVWTHISWVSCIAGIFFMVWATKEALDISKAELIISPFLPVYSSQGLPHHGKWHLHLSNCPQAIINKSCSTCKVRLESGYCALPHCHTLVPVTTIWPELLRQSSNQSQLPAFCTLILSPHSSLSDFSFFR